MNERIYNILYSLAHEVYDISVLFINDLPSINHLNAHMYIKFIYIFVFIKNYLIKKYYII